jgi:hypothetical protein
VRGEYRIALTSGDRWIELISHLYQPAGDVPCLSDVKTDPLQSDAETEHDRAGGLVNAYLIFSAPWSPDVIGPVGELAGRRICSDMLLPD